MFALLDKDCRTTTATTINNERKLYDPGALQLRPQNHRHLIEPGHRSLRTSKLNRQRHPLPVRQTRLNSNRLRQINSSLAIYSDVVAGITV